MAIFGAFLVGRILDSYAYPNNFALLFLLAFLGDVYLLCRAGAQPRTAQPAG